MRSYRLFCPDLTDNTVVLTPEESHHAATALRVKPGDDITLFDGAGTEAAGVITRVNKKRVDVALGGRKRLPFELSCKLTLAVAMGRTHRQAYLVEKCTELGVAAIWPLITEHSTTRPGASAVTKWERRAIESAKQSHRAWVPKFQQPMSLKACLDQAKTFDVAAIADTERSATPLPAILERGRNAKSMLVLVGPEGGWSDAERDQAAKAKLTRAKLSPTVLRTETAAVAICAAVAMGIGRNDAS